MTAISGSYSEVFWTNKDSSGTPIDATELNTFTAEASLIQGLEGQPTLPARLFDGGNGGLGRILHLSAAGVLGATGTPTFQLQLRLGTSASGISMGASVALAAASGITNALWFLDFYMMCTAIGPTGSLRCWGHWRSPAGLASPFGSSIPSLTASWQAVIDTTIENKIWLAAICGTSNAANKIQVKSLLVRGLN